ncbi:MAG: glycosyltransferase family 2 protein [Muribaculaceae bacterium]
MRLSIVILTCNQSAYTLRCLASLSPYMQAHADAEVVLVDNGSTDGTAAAIAAEHYPWSSRLRLIRLGSNRGVAAGRNVGLQEAVGEVIMILDNDTIITADAIVALTAYVSDHRDVGIAAPQLLSPAGEVQDSAKPFPGLGIKLRNVLGLRARSASALPPAADPYYVIGACQVMRREVMQRVGLLDEHIFYGPEDADYCARVRAAGFSIKYLPHIIIVHDWQRATTRRVLSPLGRRHIAALLYFYRKHHRLF